MVDSGDADNNTWPRSAECKERTVEMTVDGGGREQNPKRKTTQGDRETKQQDSSKSNLQKQMYKNKRCEEIGLNRMGGITPIWTRRTDLNLLNSWGFIVAVYFGDIAFDRGAGGISGPAQLGGTNCGIASMLPSGKLEVGGHLQIRPVWIRKTSKVQEKP